MGPRWVGNAIMFPIRFLHSLGFHGAAVGSRTLDPKGMESGMERPRGLDPYRKVLFRQDPEEEGYNPYIKRTQFLATTKLTLISHPKKAS